jgi:hypothetical protein
VETDLRLLEVRLLAVDDDALLQVDAAAVPKPGTGWPVFA